MENTHPNIASLSSKTLVAIDIGSNSFHLMAVKADQQPFRTLVRLGEKVQLAAGMIDGELSSQSIARGLLCLQRFKHCIDELADQCVLRVVATHALRLASNRQAFIEPVEQLLGCPVEVIGGLEEARLVYLGVAHSEPCSEPRLVIDVGGGSTELIVGRHFEAQVLSSLQLGCVSYLQFFANGEISPGHFQRAYDQACGELAGVLSRYRGQWQHCVGCSGILLAVEQVLIKAGLSQGGIERAALHQLKALLFEFDTIEAVRFHGLIESRRQIFASGLVITIALFDALQIERMQLSNAALRDGVLYELINVDGGHEQIF